VGRGIDAYLIANECLKHRGPKKIRNRVIRLFKALADEDKDLLERGLLPEQALGDLAHKIGESVEDCRDALLAFLQWLRQSPQLRIAELARGPVRPEVWRPNVVIPYKKEEPR
jgi:hypothetical protein